MGLKIFIILGTQIGLHTSFGSLCFYLNELGVRTQLVRLVQPVLLPTELSC